MNNLFKKMVNYGLSGLTLISVFVSAYLYTTVLQFSDRIIKIEAMNSVGKDLAKMTSDVMSFKHTSDPLYDNYNYNIDDISTFSKSLFNRIIDESKKLQDTKIIQNLTNRTDILYDRKKIVIEETKIREDDNV